MPRGIPNKKEPVVLPAPEVQDIPEDRADKLARLTAIANDGNQHPTERLWAMRQIAEIKAGN